MKVKKTEAERSILDRVAVERFMKPETIVSDNGRELTSRTILEWQNDRGVVWHYIAPGRPIGYPAS